MSDMPVLLAMGLMSGTSQDGIDAALIRSDGREMVEPLARASFPYGEEFRARLRGVLGGKGPVDAVERELTLAHATAVKALLDQTGLEATEVALIGFHGHTILHDPDHGRTWQIGDGALLAREAGIDVVADLRGRDVAEGGQGAPLAPAFHAALASKLERPLAVLNIGGVSNVTWIGSRADGQDERGGENEPLLAFDCGPGNALINDWVERHTGEPLDRDGHLAKAGEVDEAVLSRLLADPYFALPAPKSLDRDHFDPTPIEGLSLEDGAATLTAFTAAAIEGGLALMPAPPKRWLVTGGGRLNPTLMAALSERLAVSVEPVEAVGWDGDALEAQAFAYLAIRSLAGLPLSFPTTTGVRRAVTGGRAFPARHSAPNSTHRLHC